VKPIIKNKNFILYLFCTTFLFLDVQSTRLLEVQVLTTPGLVYRLNIFPATFWPNKQTGEVEKKEENMNNGEYKTPVIQQQQRQRPKKKCSQRLEEIKLVLNCATFAGFNLSRSELIKLGRRVFYKDRNGVQRSTIFWKNKENLPQEARDDFFSRLSTNKHWIAMDSIKNVLILTLQDKKCVY
jgi:hypothetical protein